MISAVRANRVLSLVLFGALCFYVCFPLQFQAPEAYNYATAIEGYFRNSGGFALAQGQELPDFGRYHPNHPMGHVLAGWAYDWLRIPALDWMRLVNIIGALFAGLFLYQIARFFGIAKNIAALAAGLFLATYCGMFTVLSGEWHIPAIALSLAGIRQIFIYVDDGATRNLYRASLLLAIASCYHLWAFFYLMPVGLVLLFVRSLKKFWRELMTAALIIFVILLCAYIIFPFVLFRFQSSEDFFRTFLMYKYLSYAHYSSIEWLQMAGRTLLHTFLYTPARLRGIDAYALIFITALALSFWKFYKSERKVAQKAIIVLIPVWWPFLQMAMGARPDGLLGWLFAWPFICLILIRAISVLHRHAAIFGAGLSVVVFTWNFAFAYYPNIRSESKNVFYFDLPREIPSTTPVAFVISQPLLMMGEIWYAGSKSAYRNQMHFMPCCGENNYLSHLKRWALENPGFVLVADERQAALESFFRAHGLAYKIWSDRRGDWPSALVPTTLYIQHKAPNFYPKRLTVWVPDGRPGTP